MILRYSSASPYARKVRSAAALLGCATSITLVAADTTNPADGLRDEAPLVRDPHFRGDAFYAGLTRCGLSHLHGEPTLYGRVEPRPTR